MSGGGALRAAWEAAQKPAAPAPDNLFPDGKGKPVLNNDAAMMIQGQMPNQSEPDPTAPSDTGALRKAWEAAQVKPNHSTAPFNAEEPPVEPSRKINMETPPLTSLASTPAQAPKQSAALRVATHVGNIASGIPGVEAAGAAAGSAMGGIPYQEALRRIRAQESTISPGLRTVERMAGAAPLAAVLPGSPAVSGAIFGGADQALAADPMSLGERAVRTGAGAAGGALVGKAADKLQVGARALLPARLGGTPDPASNIIARQAARALSAKQLYSAAAAEGQANGATPAIQAYLAEPEIASRVAALQQLDEFRHVAPDGPEMLDALYKTFSDEAKAIGKGLATADPSKPNTGRYRLSDIQSKKQGLIDAMGAQSSKTIPAEILPEITTAQSPRPTTREAIDRFHTVKGVAAQRTEGTPAQQMARQALERHSTEDAVAAPSLRGAPGPRTIPAYDVDVPPMMPSYQNAVSDFAQRTADINAVGKGMTASQGATKPTRPTFNQITSKTPKTPQTFSEWAKTATQSEIQAAREGILGDVKNSIHEPGKTLAPFRRAAGTAADLLRRAPDPNNVAGRFGLPPQDGGSMAAKLGLTFLTSDPFNR